MTPNDIKTSHAQLRKMPKQARSLARFNHILDEAEKIIEENGCEGLGMNELARRANVNIASIYQYFPHRAAIIRQLIERYLGVFGAHLAETLGSGKSMTVNELICSMIDDYCNLFMSNPVFSAIWCDAQGDPVLKQMDIEDTRQNTDQIMAFLPQEMKDEFGEENVRSIVFLIGDQTGSLLQTAIMLGEEEGKKLIETYKDVLSVYIEQKGLNVSS